LTTHAMHMHPNTINAANAITTIQYHASLPLSESLVVLRSLGVVVAVVVGVVVVTVVVAVVVVTVVVAVVVVTVVVVSAAHRQVQVCAVHSFAVSVIIWSVCW